MRADRRTKLIDALVTIVDTTSGADRADRLAVMCLQYCVLELEPFDEPPNEWLTLIWPAVHERTGCGSWYAVLGMH